MHLNDEMHAKEKMTILKLIKNGYFGSDIYHAS